MEMRCGVPLGSILGPTLRNAPYDIILEIKQPDEITALACADDLGITVVTRIKEETESKVNTTIENNVTWLEEKKLQKRI